MQRLKKVLAVVLAVAMVMTGTVMPVFATTADFDDTANHWAEAAIGRWADANILSGDGEGNFRPNDDMTRAELAKVACVLLGLDEESAHSASFTDIAGNEWYADYVLACADAGIINGMGDGTFAPESAVTREQAFKIIAASLKLNKTNTVDLAAFADGDQVSEWAVPYVKQLVACKAVNGYATEAGFELRPQNHITRAEVAKILDYLISIYVTAAGEISTSSTLVPDAEAGNQVVINQVVVNGEADVKVDVKVNQVVDEETGEVVKTEIAVVVKDATTGAVKEETTVETENTDVTTNVVVGNATVPVAPKEEVEVAPGVEQDPEDEDYGKCTHLVKKGVCTNCAVGYENVEYCVDEICDDVVVPVAAHGHKMVDGVCECCGMTLDAAMKFHAWVESNGNAVDVFVTNDYVAQITVDPGKVDANEVTLGVEMQNVGSLGVNGVRRHVDTFTTGLSGDPELSVWLKNVFKFNEGTINANIDGKEVAYTLTGAHEEGKASVITGTPSSVEAARDAWGELTGHVTTSTQEAADSYINIANGSYMIIADDKLCFEKGTTEDLKLDNFGDLDAMEAQIRKLVQLTGAQESEFEAQFYLAAGTKLAVSNSVAVLEDNCLVTVNADKLGEVEGLDTILEELRDAESGYAMAESVVKLVNELVGAADGSTIEVNFTFTEPVEKATKFYFGVTANNAEGEGTTTVDLEVFDDYSLEINLPMNKISSAVVTLTAKMANVGSLGVEGTREHSQTVNTGMTATGDLAFWMSNAATFTNATINVKVGDQACTYVLESDMDADWVTVTGKTDTEAARGVWHALVNDNTVVTRTQEVSDSYIKIANGSYINTGAETLKFENPEAGDLVLDNFSNLEAVKAAIKEAVCAVKNDTVGTTVTLYVAEGTELAVSNSVATLQKGCTVTITGLDLDDNLLAEIREASNGGNEALVKALFNILNDFVGAANGKTVNVEFAFDAE